VIDWSLTREWWLATVERFSQRFVCNWHRGIGREGRGRGSCPPPMAARPNFFCTIMSSSSFLACNSYDCVAPYVDIILHRGWFWAKSAASGSVRWCCFRSCWTVLSHVMRGRPSCLLQSSGGEANRILLASALSSMRIMCPNRVSKPAWLDYSSEFGLLC